ncbi:hypothetical protein PI124_g2924 [Phytophthora idaei]|nr:hypothetical protein PI125_g4477 [Phytophthora idaei]KAG3152751.1 hypothetical protein PI126_g10395 [Phytophthora idaei]KAG3252474.1 hypothetical protein PI124_g2924 [Phytophthora idaei]
MNEITLARELIRARLSEPVDMKPKLDDMARSLERILRIQLEFQSRVEENEERNYELATDFEYEGTAHDVLSFEVLLEMAAINRLRGAS